MDVLSCLDWCNSCLWNLPSMILSLISTIILLIFGVAGSGTSFISALIATVVYTVAPATGVGVATAIPYTGRFVTSLFAAIGAILAVIGGCGFPSIGGGFSAIGSLLGWLSPIPYLGRWLGVLGTAIGGTAALPTNAIIGSIIGFIVGSILPSLISPITATCESICHNLIWIIGSPIVIRAAYTDGCLEEFLKACYELIRHLI